MRMKMPGLPERRIGQGHNFKRHCEARSHNVVAMAAMEQKFFAALFFKKARTF